MTRNKHLPPSRPLIAALLAGLVGMFVLTAAACSERSSNPAPTQKAQETGMKTVLIPIEGMSCISCAARVTKTIESLHGVADAEVNVADRQAQVQFAPNEISVTQIVAAVNGLGYQASVPAEAK
jgi:copper chaperone CopZ